MPTSNHMKSNRWLWLRVVVVAAFIALLLRLFAMQIIDGNVYQAKIEKERQEQYTIAAPRGRIYDAKGEVLADSKPRYKLLYLPLEETSGHLGQAAETMARLLEPILKKSVTELLKRMDVGELPELPLSMPRMLVDDADDQQLAFIREHQEQLSGIRIVTESKREYKQHRLTSHVLGYLNSISAENWKAYQAKGYSLTSLIGVYGLEKQYESYLKGKDGALLLKEQRVPERSYSVEEKPGEPGFDLYLNLDSKLQAAAETALQEQIRALNEKPRRKQVTHAAAVAMDPQTGAILAMASYPGFDPNIWVGGISPAAYQNFQPSQQNWALQVSLPPGSTVKPLTLLLGLKKGVVSARQRIYDPGLLQVGWRANGEPNFLHCWKQDGHGDVDAEHALSESCNVYMYQLALKLGRYRADTKADVWLKRELPAAFQEIQDYHRLFGLGRLTGVDLPDETPGRMELTGQLADLPFAAIGQNQSYTAMQLAQYVSVLANGGKRMEPHVAQSVRERNGKPVLTIEPKVLDHIDIKQEDLQVVRAGMRDTIEKPYGTAFASFRGTAYTAAGKTGTAETGRGEDHSLFIGYAPVEHPRIAIAVIVPEGGHGSDSSGPIARKILDSFFKEGNQRKTGE